MPIQLPWDLRLPVDGTSFSERAAENDEALAQDQSSVPALYAFEADVTNAPAVTYGAHTVVGGSGSAPAVTWVKVFDTSNVFDITTGRFTPKLKGVYEFYAVIYWSAFSADQITVITDLFKNGALVRRGQIARSSGVLDQAPSALNCQQFANGTTDFFQLGYFNGSAAAGVFNGNGNVFFGARLVGTN